MKNINFKWYEKVTLVAFIVAITTNPLTGMWLSELYIAFLAWFITQTAGVYLNVTAIAIVGVYFVYLIVKGQIAERKITLPTKKTKASNFIEY